jgi:heptaprenyl diphosphate synthase
MKLKTAHMGLLLATALILSYIESLIPFFFGVPGMKLGLPNMAIVMALYMFGWKEAIVINVFRIVISGFLFGNMYGILFSLSGAVISFIAMLIIKSTDRFSMTGTSIIGGVFHNIAQILVAAFVVKTSGIIYYMPVLIIAGVITGFINGTIASQVMTHLRRIIK